MSVTNFSFSEIPMASLVLFVAFLAPLIISPISTYHDPSSTAKNGFQSTLIHVDHDKSLTKTELLRRTLERGKKRVLWLQSKIKAYPAIETPILDASGAYLMKLSIGTPKPSPITAIMDTGSDLTWIQCKPCNPCFNQSTPIYDPQKSLSYSKLGCSTKLCKALPLYNLICNNGCCNYNITYVDGSSTRGALATETFTFEGNVTVPEIGFGCGSSNKGDFLNSSGIVGLGRGALSLVSQMNEPMFSYCLPTFGTGGTGVLRMGCQATNPPGVHVNTTPLIKNPYDPRYSYYYLSLEGISIGQTRLKVDKSTFAIRKDGSGGLVIDAGTTLTYLVESAFDQVTSELTHQLGLKTADGRDDIGSDVCFNMTSHHRKRVKFPVIVFHLGNGVNLESTHKNYFFTDTDSGVGCLMMGKDSKVSFLGNYQQQNILVVYDLAKQSLSFLPNYRNCGGRCEHTHTST